eukprot:TRINITY_DN20147_c0_g1_i1.p1 TRINITY_DN20147_c0_g1~~TRINITY_DN20147_c0_g1_i1.p1  ORF type:complete len:330 (+),score=45.78 TRINITY_DN20147_c0_g1_i1:270-1259(+)
MAMVAGAARPSVILATASYDHTIKFWDATEGNCYRNIHYADSQVNQLEITPDKQFLAAGGNPHVRLYDISNPSAPLINYDGHTNNVTAIGFQSEGLWMYTGSEDGTVRLWDLRAPGCQREYESRAAVNTVVLHPNQMELISGDQAGNIRVWDLKNSNCSFELVPEPDTAIRSLAVKGDGSLVVAANNSGTCYCWRLNKGTQHPTSFEPHHKLQAHKKYILKTLFSPEYADDPNRWLATCSADGTVNIWNPETFKLEKTLAGHQRWVWDCVFSVDGAYLVTASSDQKARLWEIATGECIREYEGHTKACVACALHDGTENAPGDMQDVDK